MSTLFYLEYRQFVNMIKLTFRTPKRLIPVLLFGLWMLMPIMNTLTNRHASNPFGPASFGIQLKVDVVHLAAYLLLALAGLYLIQRSFSESLVVFSLAEIDVVIPTPIARWKVMALKLAKIYLKFGALLALLSFFMLPGIATFIGRWSMEYTPVTWLALVLYGALIINVCTIINLVIQYASPKSGVWPRVLIRAATYSLLVIAAIVMYVGYVRTGSALEAAGALIRNPLFVFLMLPAAWASNLAMSPAMGWMPVLGLELLALGVLVGVSYALVLARRENPYEPSLPLSIRTAAIRQAMRSGGFGRLPADMWKKRAVGMQKISLAPFGRGATAILWKNLLISLRVSRSALIGAVVIIPAGMLALRLMVTDSKVLEVVPSVITGATLYLLFFTSMMMLQGLRRDLKQGDILKPMPIPAWQMMAAQTGHAGLLITALVWLIVGSAVTAGGIPIGEVFVYAALALPFVAYGSVCAQLPAVVLYPNMQDVSQQYIGGLLSMLLSGIALGPPIGLGVLFWYFKLPMWLGIPIVIAVSLAIAIAGITVGAAVYRRHDPTEE